MVATYVRITYVGKGAASKLDARYTGHIKKRRG